MIEIIFHDIDGCLNSPNGEDFGSGHLARLSELQLESLRDVGQWVDTSGAILVLNTGRNLEDSLFIAQNLKCENLRYALLEHSAYAWDFKTEREVHLGALAKELGDEERFLRYKDLLKIQTLLDWYREKGRSFLSEALDCEAPVAMGKKANLSIQVPEGLAPNQVMKTLQHIVEQHFEGAKHAVFQYCHSQFFVDVLGPIHKSDGAFLLAKYLCISPENSLVVGDGMNDIDMFMQWPKLLCPANADGRLKELCRQQSGQVSDFSYAEASVQYLKQYCSLLRSI